MFRGLNGRIILAFTFVILLALIISGLFAIRTTTNEFELFITEEGWAQANDIAVFLEASYNSQGEFNDLEALLNTQYGLVELLPEDSFLDEPFLDEAILEGVTIVEDQNGDIIFEEAYYPYEQWNPIAAAQLEMSLDEFEAEYETASIADMAEDRDIPVESIIAAIMSVEQQQIGSSEELLPEEAVFFLSDILYWVQDYVYLESVAEPELVVESAFFFDTLFDDARVLMANADGDVVFDSLESELVGESLTDDQLFQGVAIYDWSTREPVATVIVAAGEGFFDTQQQLFLNNVIRALVIGGVGALVAALVVGWLLARQISAPVTALTQATTRLATGDTGERLPIHSTDELGKMSKAFNTLADALDTQQMLRHRLVADVSHELNTPLSVIQLEMEALRDGIQLPDEAVSQVLHEINLLRNLTQDLTLLADRDQGMLTLSLESVNMAAFVPQAVSRWQSKAEAAGVEVVIRPFPPLHTIQADPVRLSQVLGNLIRNALEHTPPGGQIEVSCANRTVPAADNDWVVTTVRDNGSGIAAADLPFIFERFYKSDTARQRDSGGRGLGLAIVQDIMELHGGQVWVESTPGEGS
ncbi:MAG: HAMP domain-containing protein, partial [Chloroflexi bacterium]|nr:HAMP domain-containing protein [Chloroflexota bacterium]